MANGECLDLWAADISSDMKLDPCHKQGEMDKNLNFWKIDPSSFYFLGGNQFFALAQSGQIVTNQDLCVGIIDTKVILVECFDEDKSQLWKWDEEVNQKNNFLFEINPGLRINFILL